MKINLELFNEVYDIQEKEPVYTYYDIMLQNEISDSEEYVCDMSSDYKRQDAYSSIDGYHQTYFIFERVSGQEVFRTSSDGQLINKIKELNKVLILEKAEIKESEIIDYEEFIEALESVGIFNDIVLSESTNEFKKYDDERIQEIADYLDITFEE